MIPHRSRRMCCNNHRLIAALALELSDNTRVASRKSSRMCSGTSSGNGDRAGRGGVDNLLPPYGMYGRVSREIAWFDVSSIAEHYNKLMTFRTKACVHGETVGFLVVQRESSPLLRTEVDIARTMRMYHSRSLPISTPHRRVHSRCSRLRAIMAYTFRHMALPCARVFVPIITMNWQIVKHE